VLAVYAMHLAAGCDHLAMCGIEIEGEVDGHLVDLAEPGVWEVY